MTPQSWARPGFALSAAVALVCSLGVALAAPTGSAGTVSPLGITVERTLVWAGVPSQAHPLSFSVSSQSVDAPTPDSFQIDYQTGTFNLTYQPSPPQVPRGHVSVSLDALVEWDPTISDGQLTNDSTLQVFPLGSSDFGRIPVQTSLGYTSDGGKIQSFVIASNGNDVVVNLTIAERFLSLPNGETLTPMEAKLSLQIHHVMQHAGARLGLLLDIQTSGTVPRFEDTSWDDEHSFSHGDDSVNVTNESNGHASTVFLAWQTRAAVNGAPVDVNATGPDGNDSLPGSYRLYLAYGGTPAGNGTAVTVVHDPDLGVVSLAYASLVPPTPPLQADYLVYAVTVAGLVALVVASVVLVARRRREK